MAQWLNTTFYGLDSSMFALMNSIKCSFLTGFSEFFAILGDGGLSFIIASIVLMLFAKTRRMGFCMLLAIAVGALFTNITLKPLVARPRPYTHREFVGYWQEVGANIESARSFPSGHTTSCTAFVVAFFLMYKKKWSWVALLGALCMAFSRVYLIVHYTTDVVAGLIVGSVGAIIAYYLTKLIYRFLSRFYDNKLVNLFFTFGLVELWQKIFNK